MITGKDFQKILWAFFFLCLFFVSQGLGGILAVVMGMSGQPQETVMLTALVVANAAGILLFAAYWLIVRPADLMWRGFREGIHHGRTPWRTLLSFLLAPPLIYLVNWLQGLLPSLPDWVGEQNLEGLMQQPLGVAVVAVVGPICEELLFRGGVQRSLHRAFAPWTAITGSALLFSLVHFNPAQMPAAFVLGLLLGFAYWWSGSLLAPICIHILNNSTATALSLLSPDDDSLIHFVGGSAHAAALAAASLLILLILFRAVQKEGVKRG